MLTTIHCVYDRVQVSLDDRSTFVYSDKCCREDDGGKQLLAAYIIARGAFWCCSYTTLRPLLLPFVSFFCMQSLYEQ